MLFRNYSKSGRTCGSSYRKDPCSSIKTVPSAQKELIIYDPVITDKKRKIRRSSLYESGRLAYRAISCGISSILFTRSRINAELLVENLKRQLAADGKDPGSVRGYRSGYLPAERRETEKDLKSGKLRAGKHQRAGTGYRHRFPRPRTHPRISGEHSIHLAADRQSREAEQPLSRSHNTVSPSCGQVSRREAGMASRGISRKGQDRPEKSLHQDRTYQMFDIRTAFQGG